MIPQIFKCGLYKWEEKLLSPKVFWLQDFPILPASLCSPRSCGFVGKASDNHLASLTTLIKRAGESFLHLILRTQVSMGQNNASRRGGECAADA